MAIDFNTDPYGAWGTLLGTVLGQSYNKNAQNRERAKADKIIDSIRNQQEIERIAALRQAPTDEDAVDIATKRAIQQDAQPIGGVTKGIDYLGMGDKYGENPYQFGTAESYLDKMFKPAGGKQYAIEQANKASVDAIHANQKQQAQLSPYERILSNWNPDYTEDNVRAKLKAADVRDSIIDEKLGEVRKDVAKRAEAVLLPSIQKKMFYGYDTVEKGEDGNLYSVHHDPDAVSFMQAMAELETLKQYSPDTYKTYASQIVGPQALYNERVADKRYDKQVKTQRENAAQQHQWKVEDTILANKLAMERAKVTAAYRQSLVNAGRTGGRAGLKMSDIKELVELGKSALESDNPALQRRGQQILAQAYSLLGGDNGGGSVFANRDPDWNNYNDAMTAAHEALNAGSSKEKVAAELKQHMGDGELYRKVISDLGIGSTENNSSAPSNTSKKTDVQEILFPKPDNDTWLHWLTDDDDHTTFLQRLGVK